MTTLFEASWADRSCIELQLEAFAIVIAVTGGFGLLIFLSGRAKFPRSAEGLPVRGVGSVGAIALFGMIAFAYVLMFSLAGAQGTRRVAHGDGELIIERCRSVRPIVDRVALSDIRQISYWRDRRGRAEVDKIVVLSGDRGRHIIPLVPETFRGSETKFAAVAAFVPREAMTAYVAVLSERNQRVPRALAAYR